LRNAASNSVVPAFICANPAYFELSFMTAQIGKDCVHGAERGKVESVFAQLAHHSAIEVHGCVGCRFGGLVRFKADPSRLRGETLHQSPERGSDGLRRCNDLVQGAGLEGSNLVRPSTFREVFFVFGNQKSDSAFRRGNRQTCADDRPIAREEEHIYRQRADNQVPLALAQRIPNSIDALGVPHAR
jgi:hypothetical protein